MTPTNIADTCKVVLHSLQLVNRRLCDAVEQGVTVVQARASYAGCHSFGNIKGQTRTKMSQSSEVVVAGSYDIVNMVVEG